MCVNFPARVARSRTSKVFLCVANFFISRLVSATSLGAASTGLTSARARVSEEEVRSNYTYTNLVKNSKSPKPCQGVSALE